MNKKKGILFILTLLLLTMIAGAQQQQFIGINTNDLVIRSKITYGKISFWVDSTSTVAKQFGVNFIYGKKTSDLTWGILNVKNFGSGVSGLHTIAALTSPNMTTGNYALIGLGKNMNTSNSDEGLIFYNYRAAASDSNSLGFAFGNNIRPLQAYAAGNVRIQNQLRVGDGTSLLPSFSFSNDPSTGMYYTGSNVLSLTSNGIEGLRMTGLDFWVKRNTITMGAGNVILENSSAKFKVTSTGVQMTGVEADAGDTTNNKPLGIDASGNIKNLGNWPSGGGGGATEPVDYSLKAYAALGSTTVAQTVGCPSISYISNTTGTNMGDGTVYFIPVWIPKAQTITGVKWFQRIQGSYTADNYNGVGLYSYSGGNLTLVASSTTDANIWSNSIGNTFETKAFSSTYSASAGLYFVALILNYSAVTTAPQIATFVSGANASANSGDFTNSAKLFSTLASQTALPSPTQAMSSLTNSAVTQWIGLY